MLPCLTAMYMSLRYNTLQHSDTCCTTSEAVMHDLLCNSRIGYSRVAPVHMSCIEQLLKRVPTVASFPGPHAQLLWAYRIINYYKYAWEGTNQKMAVSLW